MLSAASQYILDQRGLDVFAAARTLEQDNVDTMILHRPERARFMKQPTRQRLIQDLPILT